MKKAFTLLSTCILAFLIGCPFLHAQNITTPPASKKAVVAEWIGLTKVAVHYHRPGVKERDGKIYGEGGIVPYNDGNPMPWRAGANENTTMYFEDAVTINGQPLEAGKYGFHVIPAESKWTLIFSNNHHSWGSYFYDPAEDALRVEVVPAETDFTEWLTYDFVNQTDQSADIRLRWERKQVTFTVGVDVGAVTMAGIEKELEGIGGFNSDTYAAAAQYVLTNDQDLEKAVLWSERSMDPNYGGQKNFNTVSTYAMVMDKAGKRTEAASAMEEALELGTMRELHFFGRQLIQNGQPKKAMMVFKTNRERHPDDNFTTIVGLARGNMALGEFEHAAKHFKAAAENAPQGQATYYEDLAKQCREKMQKGG